ncbi:MAG TPA: FkbM family methyltransferase [Solirubrobacteraceae bacterium]|jgi:FkbM family methyltransferase|nr:FkbM family methyltransferase [Solirubrobacteraceae bacterium]
MPEQGWERRAGAFLHSHRRMRLVQKRLTRPLRHTSLPIFTGAGRGLRVRFGESALTRAVARVEPQVEDTLLGLLGPGAVFYDIGANVGWYSLLAARAVGAAGRVVAFEPAVANAALLQHNVAANQLSNVTTITAAVTDRGGWATFLYGGSLEGRLSKNDNEAQAQRRAARKTPKRSSIVPILALDAWLAETEQPPPSVVKIDVEGAEVGVLRGMAGTLRGARPTLLIELHNTRAEVADVLDELGYEHAPIESDASTREGPWWAHVLARPPATPAVHQPDGYTANGALAPSHAS